MHSIIIIIIIYSYALDMNTVSEIHMLADRVIVTLETDHKQRGSNLHRLVSRLLRSYY